MSESSLGQTGVAWQIESGRLRRSQAPRPSVSWVAERGFGFQPQNLITRDKPRCSGLRASGNRIDWDAILLASIGTLCKFKLRLD